MKRLLVLLLAVGVGVVLGGMFDGVSRTAEAGGDEPKCAAENGDVNADGKVNISDGITILGYIFRSSPTELVPLWQTQT